MASELISLRAYARHRAEAGFNGGTLRAVQQAIEDRRLSASISLDAGGVRKINSMELADNEWRNNTRHDFVRAPDQAAKVGTELSAIPATPVAAPPPVAEPVTPAPAVPAVAESVNVARQTEANADIKAEFAAHLGMEDDGSGDGMGESIPDDATTAGANRIRAVWQARQTRLDYLEKAGKLIPVDSVQQAWTNIVTASKTKLLGIPAKAKTRIPAMQHGDLAILDGLIREALEDLCSQPPLA